MCIRDSPGDPGGLGLRRGTWGPQRAFDPAGRVPHGDVYKRQGVLQVAAQRGNVKVEYQMAGLAKQMVGSDLLNRNNLFSNF